MDPHVTQLIDAARQGKPGAAEDLLREVYDQLRKIAQLRMNQERRSHTLQATALVHEAYLRLLGSGSKGEGDGESGTGGEGWGAGLPQGRAQFFAAEVRPCGGFS